jgi:hypothetical protein
VSFQNKISHSFNFFFDNNLTVSTTTTLVVEPDRTLTTTTLAVEPDRTLTITTLAVVPGQTLITTTPPRELELISTTTMLPLAPGQSIYFKLKAFKFFIFLKKKKEQTKQYSQAKFRFMNLKDLGGNFRCFEKRRMVYICIYFSRYRRAVSKYMSVYSWGRWVNELDKCTFYLAKISIN